MGQGILYLLVQEILHLQDQLGALQNKMEEGDITKHNMLEERDLYNKIYKEPSKGGRGMTTQI
jgi:hypothetical protein